MKKVTKLLLSLFIFVGMLGVNFSNTKAMEKDWIETVDSSGNVIETLNMTDEEIVNMQIESLKRKYEKGRMDEYIYSYSLVGQVYDSGSGVTSYILVGGNLSWAQRSEYSFSSTVGFSVSAAYKAVTGSASLSMTVGQKYSFNSSMDSKLGAFAQIKTNRYNVTVSEKYSGRVISKYTENMALVFSKSTRPVYINSSSQIVYNYSGSYYRAKTLRAGLKSGPLSSSDFVYATNTNFF